ARTRISCGRIDCCAMPDTTWRKHTRNHYLTSRHIACDLETDRLPVPFLLLPRGREPRQTHPKRPLSPPRETHLVTGTVVFCTEPTYCRAKMAIGGCKWCPTGLH